MSQDSKQSEEDNGQFNVFNQIYHLSPPCTETYSESGKINLDEIALKSYYHETKGEKKTNDQDEDEEEPQKLKQCLLEFEGKESSEVRTNTIEELDREYRRLLNFPDNVESSGFILDD